MSNFFHNFILNEEQQDETFDYIDISFPFMDEFHRLITCDQYDDIETYYLFNKVKIWQKKIEVKKSNKNLLLFITSFLVILSLIVGFIYNYQTKLDDDLVVINQKFNFHELSIRSKIKVIIKALIN